MSVLRTAAIVVLSLSWAATASAGKQPWVESETLEFRLPDPDGALVDAADPRFAGKVVLVDLWATWCPPCISEIPTFIDLQERYGDSGLVIVAIAFESEEDPEARRSRLQDFIAERGINYIVLDGGPPESFDSVLPAIRDVRGFPVEILIDRSGRIVWARNGYGYKKRWARKLEREIEALLATPGD